MFHIPHDCPGELADRHCRSFGAGSHAATLLACLALDWARRHLGSRRTVRVPDGPQEQPAAEPEPKSGGLVLPNRSF
ncbi:hypothetical protein M2281_002506 [Mesorhizobium soli]|nr:hypothetical protein [Mesorhizobium soli]